MTLVNIDLRNQGYEAGPDDRVVFYSLLVREGDFGTISTAPVEVELVDGKASVDLAPGPVGVQIIAKQVADTRVKIGEVPPSGPTTLGAVMMVTPAYTPALQKMMIAAVERAKEIALTEVDSEVAKAVSGEVGEFKTKAEQALAKSTAAESKSDTALSKSTTAESSAGNAVSRVSALEAMSGLSPESPVDGQTANLIGQEDTLTRAAVKDRLTQHTSIYLVDDFGAVGDGVADDTAAWQSAVDYVQAQGGGTVAGGVNKTYMILADTGSSTWSDEGGIAMRSGVHIYLPGSCTLRAIPTTWPVSRVIRCISQENVRIYGSGTIDGNRDNAINTSGEWGHGIGINAGKNISIEGVRVINCRGDGVNINYLNPQDTIIPDGIVVRGVECRNNYRQGLVVGAGRNILIENSVFADTNGINPQCGIDVEASTGDARIESVTIRKNFFHNNARRGLGFYENTRDKMHHIHIDDNVFEGNGNLDPEVHQVTLRSSGQGLSFTNNFIKPNPQNNNAFRFDGPEYGGNVQGNILSGNVLLRGSALISAYPNGLNFSKNTVIGGGVTFGHNRKFTISDNVFYPPEGQPALKFVGNPVWQGTISNNHFEGGDIGIDMRNPEKLPSYITISDNIFKDTLGPAIYPMGNYTRIEDNLFWGCCLTWGEAILHIDGTPGLVAPLYVRRNLIRTPPFTPGANTNSPLYVLKAEKNINDSEMVDNRMYSTTGTQFFPEDMPAYPGSIIAGEGRVPARASEYRPTNVPAGTSFFDTTLSKLLTFYNRTWYDSTGAAVT